MQREEDDGRRWIVVTDPETKKYMALGASTSEEADELQDRIGNAAIIEVNLNKPS
jgi:hypothetical protein